MVGNLSRPFFNFFEVFFGVSCGVPYPSDIISIPHIQKKSTLFLKKSRFFLKIFLLVKTNGAPGQTLVKTNINRNNYGKIIVNLTGRRTFVHYFSKNKKGNYSPFFSLLSLSLAIFLSFSFAFCSAFILCSSIFILYDSAIE